MNHFGIFNINVAKIKFAAVTGLTGGIIAEAFGGWSSDLTTLAIFMAADYILGIIVAAVFNKSDKSDSGALSSRVMAQGLFRKGAMMLVVLIAHRLDLLIGGGISADFDYFRTASVIGFCFTELLSVVENLGLMGVPLPAAIKKAIDILKKKTEADKNDDSD